MVNKEVNRLKNMCVYIWKALTDEEKQNYYDSRGVTGFISDVAKMLQIKTGVLLVLSILASSKELD